MKKKVVIYFIVISLLLILFNNFFLFNPFTYKRDHITHDSFASYTKPVSILLMKNGDSMEIQDVEKDVKKIYKELRKSEVVGPVYDKGLREETKLPYTKGLINIQSRKYVVTKIDWYGKNSDYCSLMTVYDDKVYDSVIKMTPELRELLNSYFELLNDEE